jgi:hypothetical protein
MKCMHNHSGRDYDMDALTRAYFGPANVALESLDIASTSMAPKCELALTSLVVVALVAGAAVVSIAAWRGDPNTQPPKLPC